MTTQNADTRQRRRGVIDDVGEAGSSYVSRSTLPSRLPNLGQKAEKTDAYGRRGSLRIVQSGGPFLTGWSSSTVS